MKLLLTIFTIILFTGCGGGNSSSSSTIKEPIDVYSDLDSNNYKRLYGDIIVDNKICTDLDKDNINCKQQYIVSFSGSVVNTLQDVNNNDIEKVNKAINIVKNWYSNYINYEELPIIITYDTSNWIGQYRYGLYHFQNQYGNRSAILINYKYVTKLNIEVLAETLAHEYMHYLQLRYANKYLAIKEIKEGQATLIEMRISKEVFNNDSINSSTLYIEYMNKIQSVTDNVYELLDVVYSDNYEVYEYLDF